MKTILEALHIHFGMFKEKRLFRNPVAMWAGRWVVPPRDFQRYLVAKGSTNGDTVTGLLGGHELPS